MRGEMLAAMAQMGAHRREAPPRSRLRPARARAQVRPADDDGRQPANLQVLHPHGRAELRQDRDLHAEADLRRQRLGHARPPVDLEGRQAGDGGQPLRRSQPGMPVVHRRHHQARQGAERLHQPDDQQLQAAGSRASRRRCCSPIPCATARPLAAFRGRPIRRPSGSRFVSPTRPPIPISPSPRC